MDDNEYLKQLSWNKLRPFSLTNNFVNNLGEQFEDPDFQYRSEMMSDSDKLGNIIHFKRYVEDRQGFITKDLNYYSRKLSIFNPFDKIEKLQENNNFYVDHCANKTAFSVQICTKNSDKISRNYFKHDVNYVSNFSKRSQNSAAHNFHSKERCYHQISLRFKAESEQTQPIFLDSHIIKAQSCIQNNVKKNLISSNMDNKVTIIPIYKPAVSPQTSVSYYKKEVLKHKDLSSLSPDVNDYPTLSNNEKLSMNGIDEESDFYDQEGEMNMLENIDFEVDDKNMDENTNSDGVLDGDESPTEEILEEVHRLFHSTSISDIIPPLINSLFFNVPPVIRFVREGQSVSLLPLQYQSKLKWKLSPVTPNVVKRAAKRSGFKLITKGSQWCGYFGRHLKATGFKAISENQKFNHLPGSFQIGRKDRLWRNVSILSSKNGKSKDFNFLPKTYCLPGDLKILKQVWNDDESMRKAKWILKPPASARGIGVKVINKWAQIPKKKPAIVQTYISRPLLINGSKFDLRIYVAVTSCDPLRIYVHKNGLARFASLKYSKSSKNISNRFIHLTNYSVNKKNENYSNNENHEKCQGHKWSLQTLWKHMEENLQIDWRPIWIKIKDCIAKTIMSIESNINSNIKMYCAQKNSVYELFGFDILLDSKLKPWVIEVNVSPSLHSNSPLDIEVKSNMIADLFNLVGFQLFNAQEESTVLSSNEYRRTSISASSKYQRQTSSVSINKTPIRQVSNCTTFFKNIKKEETTKNVSNLPSDHLLENIPLHQQRGYYNRQLTPNEKAKHNFYIQKDICDDQSMISSITDILTVDDARILIESFDEFNRSGDFEIIFPTSGEETEKGLIIMHNNAGCRYYNILIHQFIKKFKTIDKNRTNSNDKIYQIIRPEGIQLLNKYTQHLMTENYILWTKPTSKDTTINNTKYRDCSAKKKLFQDKFEF